MELPISLDRPLAFIDTETTGLRPDRDRIVELAVLRFEPDGEVFKRERRYNPGIPIPEEATEVHKITDADVADELPFRRTAVSLAEILDPCDLAGFNLLGFDLPILLEEFRRAGVRFDVEGRRLVDMQRIFHAKEPRDLSAAVRMYLGREHKDGAHSAEVDARATAEVFCAQLERYQDLPRGLDELHAYCVGDRPFQTPFDRWFRDLEGSLVFNQGKHHGRALAEVAEMAPDYLEWMIRTDDIPERVRDSAAQALAASGAANGSWDHRPSSDRPGTMEPQRSDPR